VIKKYRVFLVDDHGLFRESLKFVLLNLGNVDVIGEASDGREFLHQLRTHEPDLVLMDISMPNMNGIEATKEALLLYPDMRIIGLSMFSDKPYYQSMLQAGAKGFVLKESGSEELSKAMEAVMQGDVYFSKEIISSMIANISTRKLDERSPDSDVDLSGREMEVLRLICTGTSSLEIADQLSISQRTVEGHRSNILHKTKVKNSVHLLLYALDKKLIEV
jgi:DNA-binding NarL/FixJ family response regulator